jgi:hypothetical protein
MVVKMVASHNKTTAKKRGLFIYFLYVEKACYLSTEENLVSKIYLIKDVLLLFCQKFCTAGQ